VLHVPSVSALTYNFNYISRGVQMKTSSCRNILPPYLPSKDQISSSAACS
jgi:hypothetical protein